ncbi:MAG: Na/Pi cotransporter family protein [Muribaculaceae bacterium]|nr:Na/Pi cotransporter family protein [Muribaculaceae bacterium]
MDYSLLDFFALLGSICLFLYGMKVMSEGLQKAAGDRLRSILNAMTRNRLMGVTTGILITALIQSSSASTVIVVSFVNAGLMSLEQSMAVIFGANLGSTFTSWIIAILGFKVNMNVILLPLMALAVPLLFFKKSQFKSFGEFLIGFVFLFMGLAAINTYVPDINKCPEFFESLKNCTSMGFWSMLIFMGAGIVLTMIIQSSAATFAIVLVLGIKGWIPFDMACAMMLGGNVGTTITPLLASLGGNVAAKKAAMGHLMYNIFTAAIMLVFFFPFTNKLIVWLTRDVFHAGDPTLLYNAVQNGATKESLQPLIGGMSIGLALWHTVYNILSLLIMIWFTKQYVKLVNKLVKPKKKEEEGFQLKYIQGGLLSASELNIMQAQREIVVFAERVDRMVGMVKQLIHTKTGTEEFNKLFSRIGKYEDISDRMEIEIANYLNKVVEGRLSVDAKLQVATMLRWVSEIESIADSCYNVGRTLVRKEETGAHFGKENYKNIDNMLKYVSEAMSNMIVILSDIDNVSNDDLMRSYNKEREINNYRNQLRTENIENINQQKYPYQAGIFYMDIVGECEKLGDYIINVIDGVNEQRRRHLTDHDEAMASLKMEETAKHND